MTVSLVGLKVLPAVLEEMVSSYVGADVNPENLGDLTADPMKKTLSYMCDADLATLARVNKKSHENVSPVLAARKFTTVTQSRSDLAAVRECFQDMQAIQKEVFSGDQRRLFATLEEGPAKRQRQQAMERIFAKVLKECHPEARVPLGVACKNKNSGAVRGLEFTIFPSHELGRIDWAAAEQALVALEQQTDEVAKVQGDPQ